MKFCSGSSVVMRHCSAWPFSRISSCGGTPDSGVADALPLDDVDLRLDDVDAGHLLGDGVLDLDARVDLDEVELSGRRVLQELHRAGADIVGRVGDPQRVAAKLVALRSRRDRAPGARSTTFWWRRWIEQSRSKRCTRLPWRVAEDLHLDVAGALDQLFEIHLVLAEGGLGLALRLGHVARSSAASSRMTRMPRPPPPHDAFSITG